MLRVQAGVVSDKASLHKWSPSCHARTEERVSRGSSSSQGASCSLARVPTYDLI